MQSRYYLSQTRRKVFKNTTGTETYPSRHPLLTGRECDVIMMNNDVISARPEEAATTTDEDLNSLKLNQHQLLPFKCQFWVETLA